MDTTNSESDLHDSTFYQQEEIIHLTIRQLLREALHLMKPAPNTSSTSCLIEEEVLEYVKYSKSDALLIAQKTEDCAYACREKDYSIYFRKPVRN